MRNKCKTCCIVLICLVIIMQTGCQFKDVFGNSHSAAKPTNTQTAQVPAKTAALPTEAPKPTDTPEQPKDSEPFHVEGVSDSDLFDYFCEVALNVEYGGEDGILKRWESPIRVKITGDYTRKDKTVLLNYIETLNGIDGLPDIAVVESVENFSVNFIPLDEMDDTVPGYEEGNWGYFSLYWNENYEIQLAYMGIATDVTTQEMRNHLILEEFTQSLGLMDDSEKYPDSIFQAEFTQTQSLTDIDYELLKMLYSSVFESGMTENEVRDILDAEK